VILGIDTDILVSWVMTGTARHAEASQIIEDEIQKRGASLAITPIVLREFVHVVTDPKRFPRPLVMEEALRRA
jgi:predicted nucleic acid-binding protein